MTRLISIYFLLFLTERNCMHSEWTTDSGKELEQAAWRKKELAFDNVILKDLVGFFSMITLPLIH